MEAEYLESTKSFPSWMVDFFNEMRLSTDQTATQHSPVRKPEDTVVFGCGGEAFIAEGILSDTLYQQVGPYAKREKFRDPAMSLA